MSRKKLQYVPGAVLLTLGSIPLLAQVSVPNLFQAGETAVAEEVNANFQALETALNDALQRIDELESSDVAALEEHVEVIADPNNPNEYTVLFSGVNVQIVNGHGDTESINGLGNLIVGYNEERTLGSSVCSDGQYGNEMDCLSNGGVWGQSFKSGSHNIIAGSQNAYSSYGGLVAGSRNVINGTYASVSGGSRNIASGDESSVSGGRGNRATAEQSSISGGWQNEASGSQSAISGGRSNTATEIGSSVSGGWNNAASGWYSSVSGGRYNETPGQGSSISGGENNVASDLNSSVSGGQHNEASGRYSSILGGNDGAASFTNQTIPAID